MGRTQADERGHEVHTAGVGDALGKLFRLGGGLDDLQAIAQPLHRRTGDEDAALEREHRLATRAARERCQQSAFGGGAMLSGIEQQKRAGAVRVLRLSRLPASLAEQRRLLIAGDAGDGQRRAEMVGRRRAEVAAGIPHFGKRSLRDAEQLEQIPVPRSLADVIQHGTRRIGVIGREGLSVREAEDQPTVDRAKFEEPLDFGGGEVGIEHEAGARAYQRAFLLFLELRAARRGAPVLPHYRPMHGAAGRALPRAHRLALVRDPDRRRGHTGLANRFARGVHGDAQDLLGIVLDFARRWEVLRELPVAAAEHAAVGAQDARGGTGGALVECEDSGHGATPPRTTVGRSSECQSLIEVEERPRT